MKGNRNDTVWSNILRILPNTNDNYNLEYQRSVRQVNYLNSDLNFNLEIDTLTSIELDDIFVNLDSNIEYNTTGDRYIKRLNYDIYITKDGLLNKTWNERFNAVLTEADKEPNTDSEVIYTRRVLIADDYNFMFTGSISGDNYIYQPLETHIISGLSKDSITVTSDTDANYKISYLNESYLTNIIECNIDLELYRGITILNQRIELRKTIHLTYESLTTTNTNDSYDINVSVKRAKPHIVMKNDVRNAPDDSMEHHIYSYDGLYEISLDIPNVEYKKILSINRNGMLNVDTLFVRDIHFTGNVYDNLQRIVREQAVDTIDSLDRIFVADKPLYLTAKDDQIVLNAIQSDGNASDLIGTETENALLLKNYSEIGSATYLQLENSEYEYKIGISDDRFKILYNNNVAFEVIPNNDTGRYIYKFNGDFMYDNTDTIDIGSLKINSEGVLNDDTTTDNVFSIKKRNISTNNIESIMEVKSNEIITHKVLNCIGGSTTLSDARIKTNISTIENALDKVDTLRGIVYKNIMTGERDSGLIAQDVKEVLPEVVRNVDEFMLGIEYGNMMGLIVESIKELRKEINDLKSKII